jgi:hypothetical protein
MTLAPTVVGQCLDAVLTSAAPGVVIPERTTGKGFLVRCREHERSCYIGDDAVEAARFFPRESFTRSGGFDEDLTGPEDWDLTMRIAAGSRLPRIASYIAHDEGQLRLANVLARKRYYAASFTHYWRKHGRAAISQTNIVFRPAFFRNWRRFVRHPILSVGVLSLKCLEATAAVWGLLESRPHVRAGGQ